MARFMIKASEYKNVCKAVNDRKLAELKKEIIEILKKQDEKEVKKAIDYFNSQELHYTHLEKSFTGKWVEKAGYGIGTVRIWKGKKYKKIAPGKWARVFEKEGRGTNIAIGKLIARVQKIDNVEDLMAFVMANKQRFVDENGIDLPVLDKLRAAVDAKNGNVGSKGSSPKTEKKSETNSGETYDDGYKVISEDKDFIKKLRNGEMTLESLKEVHKQGVENGDETQKYADGVIQAAKDILALKEVEDAIDNAGDYDDIEELEKERKQLLKKLGKKPAEKTDEKYDRKLVDSWKDDYKDFSTDVLKEKIEEYTKVLERAKNDNPSPDQRVAVKQNEHRLKALNELLKEKEETEKYNDSKAYEGKLATQKQVDEATAISNKYEVSRNEMLKKPITTIQKYANSTVEDFEGGIDKFIEYMAEGRSEGVSMDEVGKEFAKLINHNIARKIWDDYESGALVPDEKGILQPKESEADKLSKKEEKKYKETKKMLEDKIAEFDKQLKMFDNNPNENTKRLSKDVEKQKKTYVKMLENLESEYEKTQNRSEAMKGNKNAYKGGSKEELQNELMSLSKQKSEILDEIKRTNGDLAKLNQDKYNDEARGNPTEDYDKQIEELKKKMDNLQDEHAVIEKRGNDIVKELDKLEKEEKKVIENNPKSVEGMDFVNKNKMHVLANFLANHDNVNMATAVIRLQAAYEKLGEEKFLAHFPKDIVERYRKEAGKEEPKKKSFTPISKDKMKSMSDDELKDYEAKLEKDLLATSRTDPDYVEKYNHWREVHGENNDRFHQAIEDEARAEKQAEADAKSAKEKEINEKYNGYFENRKGLDKARDLKTLEKKYNFDGKVMSSKEFVEQAMDNGVEIKEREVNKLDYPSRTRWNRMTGYEQEQYERRIKEAGKKTVYSINGFEFPKTVVDYAKFYKEKGKSKSGNEKPSKSETAIKNKATSLAGAFGYSKTYATKMGSPFNLELAEQTVDEELDWDEGSKKALKEELKRIYSEKKVQKSLFDDFVMDMFIDEDEEIEDAIKTDESLFNDYSAEQPELFNSTEMMVQEAFNRCNCL